MPDLFPETQNRAVFSASRRTDMVATDPEGLAISLYQKAPPELAHSVVLWTKNPANIFDCPALSSQLSKYDLCYVHLSVTGLGGSVLEPRVPKPKEVLALLPRLIDFLHGPEHITLRLDPIIHFKLHDGTVINNLDYFTQLAPVLQEHRVEQVTTSWVHIYGKVAKRLAERGISLVDFSVEDESALLQKLAKKHRLTLHGCCVPGWPRSSCIDGSRLNELHPRGYTADTTRATGQRQLCGCTKSTDIGWYKSCQHGCLYCYGNPKIDNTHFVKR